MSRPNTVHVIDDDEAVRDSLSFLLTAAGHDVRTYASGSEFLQLGDDAPFGCIVTDVRMPGISGLDLIKAVSERDPSPPVVVITAYADVPMAVEAMKLGAVDFIEKPFDDTALIDALDAAYARIEEPDGERDGLKRAIVDKLATLSEREEQVLNGLVAGKTNKTIAADFGISPRTVEVYRANVMTKMSAKSLSDLVRQALIAQKTG